MNRTYPSASIWVIGPLRQHEIDLKSLPRIEKTKAPQKMDTLLIELLERHSGSVRISAPVYQSIFVKNTTLGSLLDNPRGKLDELLLTPKVGEVNRNKLKQVLFFELKCLFPIEWSLSAGDHHEETASSALRGIGGFDRAVLKKIRKFREIWDSDVTLKPASQTVSARFRFDQGAFMEAVLCAHDPIYYFPKSVPEMIKTRPVSLSEGVQGLNDDIQITYLLSALSRDKLLADGSVILLDLNRMNELASMQGTYVNLHYEEVVAQLKILKSTLARCDSVKTILADTSHLGLVTGFATERGPMHFCSLGGHLEIQSVDLSRAFISMIKHAVEDGVNLDDWLEDVKL